jgi:hypothetical protein
MHENSVGHVERVGMNSEALFIIREAEDLEEITLAGYGINIGDLDDVDEVEVGSVPEPSDETEDSDIEDAWGKDFCVAQVRKAAWAVVEEARRLQFEVERYAEQILSGASGSRDESEPVLEERAPAGNGDDMVREAGAIVREVVRLQEMVLGLLARVEESAEEDNSDND